MKRFMKKAANKFVGLFGCKIVSRHSRRRKKQSSDEARTKQDVA